jgi:hypothetical protein
MCLEAAEQADALRQPGKQAVIVPPQPAAESLLDEALDGE